MSEESFEYSEEDDAKIEKVENGNLYLFDGGNFYTIPLHSILSHKQSYWTYIETINDLYDCVLFRRTNEVIEDIMKEYEEEYFA